ncbi:MAG: aldehyde dehydrogenase family protein [Ardenticatenaceae bacterium]|nr:aldehyde dehydrogenase family protein [Ardenticatenaceae bacterium]
MTAKAILKHLDIQPEHAGVCIGPGRWLESSGRMIDSYNPATGELLGKVQSADQATYDAAVAAAQKAFASWQMMPAPKRGEVVRDFGNVLRDFKEPLGDLVTLEMGKIRVEGWGEVQEMIDIMDFSVGLSRQLYGMTMGSERPMHRMYEQWHPLGPIGIITAFNFPAAVFAWNAALAAVCGDTMIWKPSEVTPLVSVAIQKLANRVMTAHGLEGIFNLTVGAGDIGRLMSSDKRLPLISFTGSIPTGRKVAAAVAERLGRSILELGGNNAIIVDKTADLEMATRGILFGAVGTAGQRCTSTRRIIAHESLVDMLTDRLVKAYQSVPMGDPLSEGTLMGPLVNGSAVQRMMDAIEVAKAQGGEVLTGGNPRPEIGENYVEPTIIRMPAQSEIVCEETFAPILYILSYSTLEEAMDLHNGVTQGLSSAIFTDSIRTAERFLSHQGSDCGIANVNIGTSGAEIGGAFGGEKDTGGGRESGSDAWKGYMRRQTNTINWSTELPLAQGIEFG